MTYLLDTNIVSELRKGARRDVNVARWAASVETRDVFLSAIVIGEIRRGVEHARRKDSAKASVLEAWLQRLIQDYADRILPVDIAVADEWGRINVPDPLPFMDGLLAATARVHDLILVTRNLSDIARAGVRCLNPFEPQH